MGYFAYQLVSRISEPSTVGLILGKKPPSSEGLIIVFMTEMEHEVMSIFCCLCSQWSIDLAEEILLIFAWLNHLYPEGTIAGSRKIVDISHRNSSQLGNLTTSTGGWVVNWKFVRHLVLVVVVHGYLHPCPMVGSQAWLLVPFFSTKRPDLTSHFLKINGHFRFLVVYASLKKS